MAPDERAESSCCILYIMSHIDSYSSSSSNTFPFLKKPQSKETAVQVSVSSLNKNILYNILDAQSEQRVEKNISSLIKDPLFRMEPKHFPRTKTKKKNNPEGSLVAEVPSLTAGQNTTGPISTFLRRKRRELQMRFTGDKSKNLPMGSLVLLPTESTGNEEI